MPTVSVICIVYNSMAYLPETVASVLAQTLTDFELIIVDDGSSDNVAEWVSVLTDGRIKLVSQANQGISGARNTGIQHARSEYLAFLDGDDLWEPTKLEQQVAVLAAQPEVGLVHTYVELVEQDGSRTNRVVKENASGNVLAQVLVKNPIVTGSVPMVRHNCFEKVGVFDPDLSFSEDWEMWARIAANYQFAVVKQPLTLYRVHAASASSKYQHLIPQVDTIIDKVFEHAPPKYGKLKKKSYGVFYRYIAWRALETNNYGEAAALHQKALEYDGSLRLTKNSLQLALTILKKRLSGVPKRIRG